MNSDMTPPFRGSSFRSDIEGLRAVAVLLVVGCHCGISWCAGGFVGVDVFFVLSGYLITGLLAAEYRRTSRIQLGRFYARRARRLLPAFFVVLVVTLACAALVLTPQELEFTGGAARAAGLYVSNVFFDRSAADYFTPGVESNPLLHTWSLGAEEQFYLLWPLLIWLAVRRRDRGRRSIWILGAVTGVSFACSVYSARLAPTFAFYELPARAWEFASGGILALLPISKRSLGTRWTSACGVVGVAMILGTAVLLKAGWGFLGWTALFPVAGTVAVLFAGAKAPQRGIGALLGAAPLQFIGARSYSWYLWHWPFIVFAAVLFPGITVGGRALAGAAALGVAALTYRFVEQPVRVNPALGARSGVSLGAAAAVTLLIIAASSALLLYNDRQLAADRKLDSINAVTTDIADHLPQDCWSQGLAAEATTCAFAASNAAQSVVLFGDSHALQWFNPMRTAADAQGWRLVTLLKPGCAASDVDAHHVPGDYDECHRWRTRAIDKIVAMHPAAVVMASYNGATFQALRQERLMSTEEIRHGTRWTLEQLSHAGIPVVVIRDTPIPPFNIPACIVRREFPRLPARESCDFDASIALNAAAFSAERAAAEGLANVHFLDLSDLICPGTSCPAILHGLVVYRDENHLAGKFAQSLAPMMRARLVQLLQSAP